ncbi:unnamed protein product [Fraxinus pennsylvanica]|uniref:Uncharacterized protein n=1 Tax=Fraxinus pennsylvanica TaxID=56036 RepID=A0AAD2EE71_9LAMI|nr:unnamed protein product [Fraxinus pennsylvanica]
MKGIYQINVLLPDELILIMFLHLDSSRDTCSLVSKGWLMKLRRHTIHDGASASPHVLIDLLARRFINVRNMFVDESLSVSPPPKSARNQNQTLKLRSHKHNQRNTQISSP